MTLVELKYLVAVAGERHFGRAARACHVSQPALSAGLKNLEEELGASLFDRGPGGVRLTSVGEHVVQQARAVLDEADKVLAVARRPAAPLTSRLRLGVIATLAPYALLPLLVPLLQKRPRLDLVLREGLTADLLGRLRLGELDAVMMVEPPPPAEAGLESEPLFDEPFVALVPARSPLAARKSVRAEELVQERLILLTEGHCFREHALAVCRGHLALEEPDRDPLAATSLHTICRMVEAGLGCTLLPRLAADETLRASRRAKVRPLSSPVPARRVALLWRARSAPSDDARALAAFVRDHLPEGVTAVRPRPSPGTSEAVGVARARRSRRSSAA